MSLRGSAVHADYQYIRYKYDLGVLKCYDVVVARLGHASLPFSVFTRYEKHPPLLQFDSTCNSSLYRTLLYVKFSNEFVPKVNTLPSTFVPTLKRRLFRVWVGVFHFISRLSNRSILRTTTSDTVLDSIKFF